MARRYSSTKTNDLQLFSCVHIRVFWLISWKTNTEAQSKVIFFCNHTRIHFSTPGAGNIKWNQAKAFLERRRVSTKITQGVQILHWKDKKAFLRHLIWPHATNNRGSAVTFYAIVPSTNIPLGPHSVSPVNQFEQTLLNMDRNSFEQERKWIRFCQWCVQQERSRCFGIRTPWQIVSCFPPKLRSVPDSNNTLTICSCFKNKNLLVG